MNGTSSLAAIPIIMAAGISLLQPAASHDKLGQQLGTVHFATSCNEDAQSRFDQGMRYQHSFWYSKSEETFKEVLKADPKCAIAYWGIALSLLENPFGPQPPVKAAAGLAALQMAKAMGAKSQREREFVDALLAYYVDYDKTARRPRLQAYLKAMEGMAQRYPDDDEVQIYYALALNVAASPNDKSFVNQLKAAAILEPILKRQPDHPGVAHYLIHTHDYPPIAHKGLDAAHRYSGIAPAAPHAQHMPSHIFTRVGAWKDSIASNLGSAGAAMAAMQWDDRAHAMDYLVYAYLQLGQDDKARAVVNDLTAMSGYKRFSGPFARAASPARYAVERGDWKGAAVLTVRPTKFAFVDAITHFARALGSARSGRPEDAKQDIAKLAELAEKLRAATSTYWVTQVDIQRQVASAWVLNAEGKYDEALKILSAAADAEDKTEKHPVTPGPLAPARELYGAMLLERGLANEALVAFEATLKKEPHRLNAALGAARAADMAGDMAKARQHYAAAVALTENGEPVRVEIVAARAFLERH